MVKEHLIEAIRSAGRHTAGDQVAPCAILWPDPEKRWESIIGSLQAAIPELFILGAYTPQNRTGPAIWLRCIVDRAVEPKLSADLIPILYLPGVGRQQLRELEDCPNGLQPIAEMQFRGTMWIHSNGKDWTPGSFLGSDRGGLNLDIAKDNATDEAMQRALPLLLTEDITCLQNQRIDSAFLNDLLTPDLPRQVLCWMDNPAKISRDSNEWKAFRDQCKASYGFDPELDGELAAASLLGKRENNWIDVWQRFSESPKRYGGVVKLLEQATPSDVFKQNPETWPSVNDSEEQDLAAGLMSVRESQFDKALETVLDLEKHHGIRRSYIWSEIGRTPFAAALEHCAKLAELVRKPLAAPSADELARLYVQSGWKTDAEAMNALACCTNADQAEPVSAAVRALYGHWLEESARNLQELVKKNTEAIKPKQPSLEPSKGRIIVFADGLRFDIANFLCRRLQHCGLTVDITWDWAAFPGVTATAKPFVSPIRHLFCGGSPDDDFAVCIDATKQKLTQDRFIKLLAESDIQTLDERSNGDPAGTAWTEYGSLDKQGHDQGWKLTRVLNQELDDLASRVTGLINEGWNEVVVITDHGWILLPGGFPKIDLPKYLVEQRWGRCAMVKETSVVSQTTIPWHWDPVVSIAIPPGIGCFRAGLEYAHGGISLQEMIIPRIMVKTGTSINVCNAKIASVKWLGLRCRVTVEQMVSDLRIDIRARQSDASSSKIEGRQPREIGADGTVSLPIADDGDAGSAGIVVLLTKDGKVIHSLPTVIGESR